MISTLIVIFIFAASARIVARQAAQEYKSGGWKMAWGSAFLAAMLVFSAGFLATVVIAAVVR